MARERRSRLPLLLLIVAVVAVVVWWRQQQTKPVTATPMPDMTGPEPTPAKAPVAKPATGPVTAAKKNGSATAAKKAPAKKKPTAKHGSST